MWIYIAHCHKVSNALGTIVPAEKPSFQTVSEGLIVLLCTEVVRQGVPDHGAVHSECSSANSRHPMSWHYHQLLCGWPETLPTDNVCDGCATICEVLQSLAMPTFVHDDPEFIRYSICHIEPVKVIMQDLSQAVVKLSCVTDNDKGPFPSLYGKIFLYYTTRSTIL